MVVNPNPSALFCKIFNLQVHGRKMKLLAVTAILLFSVELAHTDEHNHIVSFIYSCLTTSTNLSDFFIFRKASRVSSKLSCNYRLTIKYTFCQISLQIVLKREFPCCSLSFMKWLQYPIIVEFLHVVYIQ